MLELTLIEFFVRAMPEMFTLVFAAHMLAKEKIDKRKYFITSIVLCIAVFLIRLLPITFGVHTILNIIMMTILTTVISKIEIIKAIKSSMVITIVMVICEVLNIAILSKILGVDIKKISSTPQLKTMYGYPSLIFMMIFTAMYYKFVYKKAMVKNV